MREIPLVAGIPAEEIEQVPDTATVAYIGLGPMESVIKAQSAFKEFLNRLKENKLTFPDHPIMPSQDSLFGGYTVPPDYTQRMLDAFDTHPAVMRELMPPTPSPFDRIVINTDPSVPRNRRAVIHGTNGTITLLNRDGSQKTIYPATDFSFEIDRPEVQDDSLVYTARAQYKTVVTWNIEPYVPLPDMVEPEEEVMRERARKHILSALGIPIYCDQGVIGRIDVSSDRAATPEPGSPDPSGVPDS
jgi:hypothetical protein